MQNINTRTLLYQLLVISFFVQSAYAGEDQELHNAKKEILRILNRSHVLTLPCYGEKQGQTVSSGFSRKDINTDALPKTPKGKSALLVWLLSLNNQSRELTHGTKHIDNHYSVERLILGILGIPEYRQAQHYDHHTELRKVDLTPLKIKTGTSTPLELIERRTTDNDSTISYPSYQDGKGPFYLDLMNKIRECAAQQTPLELLLTPKQNELPTLADATTRVTMSDASTQTDTPTTDAVTTLATAAQATPAVLATTVATRNNQKQTTPRAWFNDLLAPKKSGASSSTTVAKK